MKGQGSPSNTSRKVLQDESDPHIDPATIQIYIGQVIQKKMVRRGKLKQVLCTPFYLGIQIVVIVHWGGPLFWTAAPQIQKHYYIVGSQ